MCTIRPRWNVMRRLVLPGPHKNQCQPASLQVICTQMYKCQTVAFRKPFKVHTLQRNVPCTNTRSLQQAPVLKDYFALQRNGTSTNVMKRWQNHQEWFSCYSVGPDILLSLCRSTSDTSNWQNCM